MVASRSRCPSSSSSSSSGASSTGRTSCTGSTRSASGAGSTGRASCTSGTGRARSSTGHCCVSRQITAGTASTSGTQRRHAPRLGDLCGTVHNQCGASCGEDASRQTRVAAGTEAAAWTEAAAFAAPGVAGEGAVQAAGDVGHGQDASEDPGEDGAGEGTEEAPRNQGANRTPCQGLQAR